MNKYIIKNHYGNIVEVIDFDKTMEIRIDDCDMSCLVKINHKIYMLTADEYNYSYDNSVKEFGLDHDFENLSYKDRALVIMAVFGNEAGNIFLENKYDEYNIYRNISNKKVMIEFITYTHEEVFDDIY